MIFADFHIHSKYSRATSSTMDIKHLSEYGSMKGLNVIGTGDFTHPKWRSEIKRDTEYLGKGIYKSRFNNMRFVLSSEIATIYSQGDSVRKIHHIIILPDFEIVEQFVDNLSRKLLASNKKANFTSDGRPIIGMSSLELCDTLFSTYDKALLIPAHIWTPWFSLFGSGSGFDKIEDCYGKYTKNIFALETGLSSDPLMNWRLSQIADKTLISNSDCHGPFVDRIGRECNVFDTTLDAFNYDYLYDALKNKKLAFTVEVDPSYGKYHFDGHRNCNICFTPKESIQHKNICPVCRRKLTIGVLHRVEELADKPEGYKPLNAVPFQYHVPLIEIIAALTGKGIGTKGVKEQYFELIKKYGNEFNIMFNLSVNEIESSFTGLGKIIQSLRDKTMKVTPGYDGVYGVPGIGTLKDKPSKTVKTPQKSILEFQK
ncbi:Uncharacterised protein [Candidatus Tiddalikarchaeum anstoanum]|nr:Uncharacterised protein [Candidatus Tiddalikarchaeum anstoanum]